MNDFIPRFPPLSGHHKMQSMFRREGRIHRSCAPIPAHHIQFASWRHGHDRPKPARLAVGAPAPGFRRPASLTKDGRPGRTRSPVSRIPPRAAPKPNKGSTDTGQAPDFIPRLYLMPEFSGGAGRNRTDDLYNAIVALSQLSYGPMEIGAPTVRRASARKLGSRPCERK